MWPILVSLDVEYINGMQSCLEPRHNPVVKAIMATMGTSTGLHYNSLTVVHHQPGSVFLTSLSIDFLKKILNWKIFNFYGDLMMMSTFKKQNFISLILSILIIMTQCDCQFWVVYVTNVCFFEGRPTRSGRVNLNAI